MTATEANDMLKAIENDDIFPLVYVAITYGLRKSEVLGLKWDAVDFEQNTLEIKSTVVKNKTIVYKDTTKTESMRLSSSGGSLKSCGAKRKG